MTTLKTKPAIGRGEIWLVEFDPTRGAEMQKTRPAVVITSDHVGKLPLEIVVPITDWKPLYVYAAWFVQLLPDKSNGLAKESAADAFQVKSMSDERFRRRLGSVTEAQLKQIVKAVALCIDYS